MKFKFREWRERQMARLCEKDKQEEEDRQKLKENAAKVEKQNVAFYSPYKNDGILPYH